MVLKEDWEHPNCYVEEFRSPLYEYIPAPPIDKKFKRRAGLIMLCTRKKKILKTRKVGNISKTMIHLIL